MIFFVTLCSLSLMPGVLGKSFLLEACVWKFLDMKLAILIACPTGYLASRYRSTFGDSVECDTVHSAFMFPVSQEEHPRINWELSMYNVIPVDEVYTLSITVIIACFLKAQAHTILLLHNVTVRLY